MADGSGDGQGRGHDEIVMMPAAGGLRAAGAEVGAFLFEKIPIFERWRDAQRTGANEVKQVGDERAARYSNVSAG